MGYWICFVRPLPGLTALQTIEWKNAQFDVNAVDVDALPADVPWTDEHRARWERVCDRVAALVATTEREELPSHLGITSADPRLRLEYSGDAAEIRVPSWYAGDDAARAIALAYAVGRIVEQETTLVGVDSHTGAGLEEENVHKAVALYVGTRTLALREIADSFE